VLIGILSAGSLAVAVLLMLWTTHFSASGALVHWGFAAVACGGAVMFAVADIHVPAGSVLLDLPAIQLAVALGWTGAAIRALATGLGRRDLPVARVGLGLAVLAFGELYRLRAGTGPAEPALLLSGLQLVGTVGVLGGVVGRSRGDLNVLLCEHERQQAALQEAAQHVQQAQAAAAERDHELANGLAGLAGIAHVLGRPTSGPDGVELRSAVLTELTRMHRMLALPGRQGEDGPFDVFSTLSELVVLRRAAGMQVDLEAGTDLVAARGRDAFVQAVTNLLGNCERHAPGSPVRVRAFETGDRVVVEIRDDGPGVPRGQEQAVLERGVRTGATGGSGLGLHVSARLIREWGGDLRVLPPQSHERGFAVRLELPRSDRGAVPAELGRVA
jgi:two-component system OmpR family sensor kinase